MTDVLGYRRFAAQGGDWSAFVSTRLGAVHARSLIGIHLNFLALPRDPAALEPATEEERRYRAELTEFLKEETGYQWIQGTRPQTLGYGLADSPAALCAWIVEKYWAWMDCNGHPENVLTRDELLDNVMLYWLPAAGASSARICWESFATLIGDHTPIDMPVGVSMYPHEIFRASRQIGRAHV